MGRRKRWEKCTPHLSKNTTQKLPTCLLLISCWPGLVMWSHPAARRLGKAGFSWAVMAPAENFTGIK